MRLDKWLKLSRVIKRRTVAQMACEQGRVFVNDKIAKPSTILRIGDLVHVELGSRALTLEVVDLPLKAPSIQDAAGIYKLIEELRRSARDPDYEDDDW